MTNNVINPITIYGTKISIKKSRSPWAFLLAFLLTISMFQASSFGATIAIDDGYTVSKRFEKYKKLDPSISLPVIEFAAKQRVQFNLRYAVVDDRELHLDLFHRVTTLPEKGLIVLIHGGGWRAGNKSHFHPLATLLAQQGFDVATPEYRLSIEAPYPAATDDIKVAMDWLVNNKELLGINTQTVTIGGGSSGGHLAALVGFKTNHDNINSKTSSPYEVNAVISLDGLLSTTTELALKYEDKKGHKSALSMWLGGEYAKRMNKWLEVSPVEYVSDKSPKLLVISSGQHRFTAGREVIKGKIETHNGVFQLIEYPKIIHTFWLFDPYLTAVSKQITSFLATK
ncbi:alpha/beta hydrolase [Psychrosphaera sp. 1_MG-2023]|nr:alpha/beta hydrolase [Psychrosphaera sp. 1_MG-2023]MDO6718778.1 alpha/beta hydrolase [Psychrosphaera sp. 1_MG-2023]